MSDRVFRCAGPLAALLLLSACPPQPPKTLFEHRRAGLAKFGISDPANLRAALRYDLRRSTASTAWLLSHVEDIPSQLEVWRDIRRRDPQDLEATFSVAQHLNSLGRFEETIELVDGLDLQSLKLRDDRGRKWLQPHDLYRRRCAAYLGQKRYAQAREACAAAIDAGADVRVQMTMTKILVAQGDLEEALLSAEDLVHDPGPSIDGDVWFTYGLVINSLDRRDEARAAFEQALRRWPYFTPAELALTGKLTGVEELQDAERRLQRLDTALGLARCWHLYTELDDFPDRAARCAKEADAIEPGFVDGQRIVHLAETRPEEALRAAEGLLEERRHPEIYLAKAQALSVLGRDAEAREVLEQALALDPRRHRVLGPLLEVCERLGDDACVGTYAPRYYSADELVKRAEKRGLRQGLYALGGLLGLGAALLVGLCVVRLRRLRAARSR